MSDPEISPNGVYAAFTVIGVNVNENKYVNEIWILRANNGDVVSVLAGEGDSIPRWNPSSTSILFLSRRGFKEEEKGNALYVYHINGGEPRRIIARKEGVSNPYWVNEYVVAFTSNVPIGDIDEDYVDIRDIPIWSDGEGFIDEYRRHLFIVDSRSCICRQLTKGMGRIIDLAPSNKGDKIAYVYVPDLRRPLLTEVHVLNISKGEDNVLIPLSKYSFTYVSWSPDDRYILLKGSDLRRGLVSHDRLWIVPLSDGELINLTDGILDKNISIAVSSDVLGFSRSTVKPIWASDEMIYFTVNDRGRVKLYRINPTTREIEHIVDEDAVVYAFNIDKSARKIAYLRLSYMELSELWILDLKTNEKYKLTRFNEWIREVELSNPINIVFKASDGIEVEGWYIPPVKKKDNTKYPAILFIHGGPKASYGAAFNFLHQLLAARGYYVIYCNPRGSDGYSEEFADIRGKYGERDFLDIMEFVDEVLKKNPDIDPKRMGVIGLSYGGFMVNWIITHSNRFKAAISMNGICDWISDYGTSDIGYWFDPDQIGGTPWKNINNYLKQSPIMYIENVKTPVIFIHSSEDYRCYIEQSLLMHVALRSLGKESKLIIFKKGSHGHTVKGKPRHRIKLYKIILDFFNEKLK